jgi:hypothetical protein
MPNQSLGKADLLDSVRQACGWLTEVAQVKHARLSDEPGMRIAKCDYADWRGATGEYTQRDPSWLYFCPIWHTGQAVRSLVRASQLLADPKTMEAAKFSAEFVLRHRVADPADEDYGLIFGFEDYPDKVNISAILESLAGPLDLAGATGEDRYFETVRTAAEWVLRKAYLPEHGLFRDVYDPAVRAFLAESAFHAVGRPIADDAVLLTVGRRTGNEAMVRAFYRILDYLMQHEDPPGNWISVAPCSTARQSIHPRHAYWFGAPFIDAFLDARDDRYLQVAIRAGRWYQQAQRRDGGLFRGTYRDFSTDSFGHATSGIACAVKLWSRLWSITGSDEWIEPAARAIDFCRLMQMTDPEDPNLRGCIVEKILPPDGTDRSLINVRDLASIFYIQAVCEAVTSGLADRW